MRDVLAHPGGGSPRMQAVRSYHHDGILLPRGAERRVDSEVLQSVADLRPVLGSRIIGELHPDAQGGAGAHDDRAQAIEQCVDIGGRDPEGSGERAHSDLRYALAQLADHLELPQRRLVQPCAIAPSELEHRRRAPQGRIGGVDAQHSPIVWAELATAVSLSTEISARVWQRRWGGAAQAQTGRSSGPSSAGPPSSEFSSAADPLPSSPESSRASASSNSSGVGSSPRARASSRVIRALGSSMSAA
ncbi:MAG TPA: hypothetical protein DCL57_07600, partial [Microbacterium sp.]|nr:hypothetical protein [Microbacterium sp.]